MKILVNLHKVLSHWSLDGITPDGQMAQALVNNHILHLQLKHGGTRQLNIHPLISGVQVKLSSSRKKVISITVCLSVLLAWYKAAAQVKIHGTILIPRLPTGWVCNSNGIDSNGTLN